MAVNEDGVLASGGDNGSLWLWDWKSGNNFQQSDAVVQPGSLDSEAGIYAMSYDMSGSRWAGVGGGGGQDQVACGAKSSHVGMWLGVLCTMGEGRRHCSRLCVLCVEGCVLCLQLQQDVSCCGVMIDFCMYAVKRGK
jgi:hypothetical protein